MTHSHRRHDISDKTWALPEPHLPGREGSWGIGAIHTGGLFACGGSAGRQSGDEPYKGGLTPRYTWPWMRLICRSESLLHKVPERIARKLVA